MNSIPFVGFPKLSRYSRGCIITEKLDGTNAQILISFDCCPITLENGTSVPFLCGSRTRWITPENDNYGFAAWAYSHVDELLQLGPGQHFGEWWGQGIQRKYGLKEKRFSLFNTARWGETRPACCDVVPVLYKGTFGDDPIMECMHLLADTGSVAAQGFMDPEGIVIYHLASQTMFKKTIKNDETPKSLVKEMETV